VAQSIGDHRRKMAVTLLAVAALGLAVSGCGRRGEPERPGASVTQDTAVAPAEGVPAEDNAKKDRPFILDPLIQ
jgi:predicted small lipoprotein YifL